MAAAGEPNDVRSPLKAENMDAFWGRAWACGETRWKKVEEAKPFTRNVYLHLVALGLVQPPAPLALPLRLSDEQAMSMSFLQGEAEAAAVKAYVAGKNVFVPLCGDSAAPSYFFEAGAAVVVGADLEEKALLANMTTNFASLCFQKTVLGHGGEGEMMMYEAHAEGRVVRLFCCDILKLSGCAAFTAVPFELVYDRASFMAMPLALRKPYMEVMLGVLQTGATVALEALIRPEAERGEGPPFHVDIHEVLYHYLCAAKAAGTQQKVTLATKSQRYELLASGRVYEWFAIMF